MNSRYSIHLLFEPSSVTGANELETESYPGVPAKQLCVCVCVCVCKFRKKLCSLFASMKTVSRAKMTRHVAGTLPMGGYNFRGGGGCQSEPDYVDIAVALLIVKRFF
jgi:hypothetical protein